tara:strand:+ start:935 stop:1657 length:723 start_codon:yes stop_codon:yes gene_type:complete
MPYFQSVSEKYANNMEDIPQSLINEMEEYNYNMNNLHKVLESVHKVQSAINEYEMLHQSISIKNEFDKKLIVNLHNTTAKGIPTRLRNTIENTFLNSHCIEYSLDKKNKKNGVDLNNDGILDYVIIATQRGRKIDKQNGEITLGKHSNSSYFPYVYLSKNKSYFEPILLKDLVSDVGLKFSFETSDDETPLISFVTSKHMSTLDFWDLPIGRVKYYDLSTKSFSDFIFEEIGEDAPTGPY